MLLGDPSVFSSERQVPSHPVDQEVDGLGKGGAMLNKRSNLTAFD